jgi:hypothetical protein
MPEGPVTKRDQVRIGGVNPLRALVLASFAVLAGCGSSDDQSTSTEGPTQTNGALITYTRTGGVGGIDEHLRIEPDGTATLAYGEPTNSEDSFDLTDSELDRIQTLLDAADLESMPAEPQPTGCADCFVYTVSYGGRTVTYDDATPPPASVGQLVTALGELAEAHQPRAAGYIKGG